MAEQLELADILSDKPPEKSEPVEQVETKPAPKPEPAPSGEDMSGRRQFQAKEQEARAAGEGKVRDPETGMFVAKDAPKEEVKEAPKPEPKPQEELTAKEKAFLVAAQQERDKRQRIEQEFNAFKAQQPKADPNAIPKTFLDDPDGALQRFQQEVRGMVVGTRLDTSESIARSRYPDFQEKVMVFAEAVKQNPALNAQMLQAPDPAEYAYRFGKDAIDRFQWQQAGGVEGMRKQIEAETRAKVEKELKDKHEKDKKEIEALPRSLAETPGKGTGKPVWGGPESLDAIIKH